MTIRFCSRYHFGHRTHKKTHILYSMHLTATLNCFEKNTQALLIVICDNLGATQHSLGDRFTRLQVLISMHFACS